MKIIQLLLFYIKGFHSKFNSRQIKQLRQPFLSLIGVLKLVLTSYLFNFAFPDTQILTHRCYSRAIPMY